MIRKVKKLWRKLTGMELNGFKTFHLLFENKKGLEIGGPSKIFNSDNYLPVYKIASKVDGCNFSNNTVWEGSIKEGEGYKYDKNKKTGYQFICEGNNLTPVKDAAYDFILSSHSLEHFANPIKALNEWIRVLNKHGIIVLVLPDSRYTFDHNRSITKFDHIKTDFDNNMQEDDLTHMEEVVTLHDYKMTPDIQNKESFRQRTLKNFENKCLHHHVFDEGLIKQLFTHLNIEHLYTDFAEPHHLIIVGRKL